MKRKNPDIIWNEIKKRPKKNKHLLVDELRDALNHNMHLSKMSIIIGYIDHISSKNKCLRVLDYGSGGGRLMAYLYLLGYTNIYGVDIYSQKNVDELNILFDELSMEDVVFHTYDTITLPFKDEQFDLIVSQQVVEHVTNISQYISECYRVLSINGRVLVDFPHRLVPFDTHTRMWIIHYFPTFIRKAVYNKYRNGQYEYYSKLLHFKTPFYYRFLFGRVFKSVEDLTSDRMSSFRYKEHYEGNIKIRSLIDNLLHLPILGKFFLKVLSIFVNKTMVLYK
jgi:SAM-dependent methyltransferase